MKFIAHLLYIAFLLCSSVAFAGGPTKEWWVCDQLGKIEDHAVWASSGVYYSTRSADDYEREMVFEESAIKHTDGAFIPVLEAECRGFEVEGAAEKYLKWRLEKASKRKIHILWIKFSY